MPKLISWKGEGVVLADRGAHHYRLIGIEVVPSEGSFLYSLIWFGTNREQSLEEQPHHIIVDRCYIHGDPKKGSRRGVALNGRHLAVVDSYVSDFKEVGADSQAILGWGAPVHSKSAIIIWKGLVKTSCSEGAILSSRILCRRTLKCAAI